MKHWLLFAFCAAFLRDLPAEAATKITIGVAPAELAKELGPFDVINKGSKLEGCR